MQRDHVLLERLLLHLARSFGLDGNAQLEFSALGRAGRLQIGELVRNQVAGCSHRGFVAHLDVDVLPFAADAAVADALVAQCGADVACVRLGFFGQGRLHVHLQHEVHAAAQVQAQVHGVGVQGFEPDGRAGHQVQRHDVRGIVGVGYQGLLDRVLGLELRVGRIETRAHRVAFQFHEVWRDASRLERLFHPLLHGGVHLDGGFGRRNLHGRCLAEEIGQGVQHPHQQHDHQDRVLPDRITVHDRALISVFQALCAPIPSCQRTPWNWRCQATGVVPLPARSAREGGSGAAAQGVVTRSRNARYPKPGLATWRAGC
ncbi:hypothetical protein D3C71_1366060 [compost metagenome]